MTKKIEFTYLYQPPKRWTFEQPKLRRFIEKWCEGKVLNLFAGKTKLDVDEYRVDLNQDMPADWYGDAFEFLKTTNMKFDTVILDPPYSLRKAYEKYFGNYIGSKWSHIRWSVSRVLNEKGRVISLGYNSMGIGRSLGYDKIAICLVYHNGDHNDIIVTVEDRVKENMWKRKYKELIKKKKESGD